MSDDKYARRSPVGPTVTDEHGTDHTEVKPLGRKQYMAKDGRMPAFVGLAKKHGGYYVENSAGITIEQALEAARINFTACFGQSQTRVDLPAVIDANGVTPARTVTLDDEGWRSTVGVWPDGTAKVFGKVRSLYQICQQTEAAALGQAIIDQSGANIVAAGGYGQIYGQRTYLAFKLPEEVLIGGEDPHDMYLTILNSFDGSGGLTGLIAPIRMQCTNQTTATFGRLAQRFVFRHSGEFSNKLQDAREAIDLTFKWTEVWTEAMEKLLAAPMSNKEMQDFTEKLLPTPKHVRTERGEGNWLARRNTILDNFVSGEDNTYGRGTRYSAYQAVTAYADHWDTAGDKRSINRWSNLLDGHKVEDIKERAGSLLLAGL